MISISLNQYIFFSSLVFKFLHFIMQEFLFDKVISLFHMILNKIIIFT